jgi:hypothetical protein
MTGPPTIIQATQWLGNSSRTTEARTVDVLQFWNAMRDPERLDLD